MSQPHRSDVTFLVEGKPAVPALLGSGFQCEGVCFEVDSLDVGVGCQNTQVIK